MSGVSSESGESYYFERQHLAHCAIHAVNNLLQEEKTNVELFNRVADRLASANEAQLFSLWNPHRVPLLGFYDVNVLMNVLQEIGTYEVDWLDQRKFKEFSKHVDVALDERIVGIIVNVQQRTLFLKGNHWFCITKKNSKWALLDSKIAQPQPFDSVDDIARYVAALQSGSNILVVRKGQHQPTNATSSSNSS